MIDGAIRTSREREKKQMHFDGPGNRCPGMVGGNSHGILES